MRCHLVVYSPAPLCFGEASPLVTDALRDRSAGTRAETPPQRAPPRPGARSRHLRGPERRHDASLSPGTSQASAPRPVTPRGALCPRGGRSARRPRRPGADRPDPSPRLSGSPPQARGAGSGDVAPKGRRRPGPPVSPGVMHSPPPRTLTLLHGTTADKPEAHWKNRKHIG